MSILRPLFLQRRKVFYWQWPMIFFGNFTKFHEILTKFRPHFAKFRKFRRNFAKPPKKGQNFAKISFPEKGVKIREKIREIRANTKSL